MVPLSQWLFAKDTWRSATYYRIDSMEQVVTIDITPSMKDLLDWFDEQPCSCATIGHIEHETDYSRETIRGNLKLLMAGSYAERRYKPTGEYRLVQDPRNEEAKQETESTDE
jgi:hypothetical protein